MSDLVGLSVVAPNEWCPECGSRHPSREAHAQRQVSVNGVTLYELSESCRVCPWTRTVTNVKMGA